MMGCATEPPGVPGAPSRCEEPDIGVVVATRNRPGELGVCLRSLLEQTWRPAVIVVVDDAPGGDLTPAVVTQLATDGPLLYVEGPGCGLAAAHNHGLGFVRTPVVAFTDDDVVADMHWLESIAEMFAADRAVGCVTGMIRPLELSTDAQAILEAYANFNKGSVRRVFDLDEHRPDDPLYPFAAGRFGSGANMAFRRDVMSAMGGFDPALGAGTRARGGDDLAAFFEVIQRGYRLVYEPGAVVYHRHTDDMLSLQRQVYGYGVGLTAYLTTCLLHHPILLAEAVTRLPAAIAHVRDPQSPKNAGLPDDYPARLTRLERLGMLIGPLAYLASRWELWRES